jgi:hypothetical protein
MSFTN